MQLPLYEDLRTMETCGQVAGNPDTRFEALVMFSIPYSWSEGFTLTNVAWPEGTQLSTIQDIANRLRQMGYTVSMTDTTMTIDWTSVYPN